MKEETFNLYIGSDNKTGELNREAIENTLNGFYEGWTIVEARGSWHGISEDSVIITVVSTENDINTIISILKNKLNQESIAYQRMSNLIFA